jgi:hypothetical protein
MGGSTAPACQLCSYGTLGVKLRHGLSTPKLGVAELWSEVAMPPLCYEGAMLPFSP